MRPAYWRAAVLLMLAASGPAAAIGFGWGRLAPEPASALAFDPALDTALLLAGMPGDATGTVGAGTVGAGDVEGARARYLPLTDEQRGRIFDGVMKIGTAPVADIPLPAAAVPGSVPLQDLPASVTREIPTVAGYKFVKLEDRILLVSPLDRAVVGEMPRYKPMLD